MCDISLKPDTFVYVWREGCPEHLRKIKEAIWITTINDGTLVNPTDGDTRCFNCEYCFTPISLNDIPIVDDYLQKHCDKQGLEKWCKYKERFRGK